MQAFPWRPDRVKTFTNIVVYPSQEVLRHLSGGAFFRGGPDWPHFSAQIYARHCWKLLPRPVDSRPNPSDSALERADRGIWCGPVSNHFGHMVADFGMRIAVSNRLDPTTPLVFSIAAEGDAAPPPFFWQILDHLAVERDRVLLVRRPTRFSELRVVPQAERRFGGGPAPGHLRLMDALTGPAAAAGEAFESAPPGGETDCVFVSRGLWPKGRFAGESYLDRVLAEAGVTVFHPETVDLHAQLRLYRRARRLIFSEGSALHALQLLGHLDADLAVLARRPRNRMAAASLRPRVRSLRYIRAASGVIYGVSASGRAQQPAGISVIDERSCIAGLRALGVDLAGIWDRRSYAECRDAEIAAWIAYRLKSSAHPGERATIARRLRALSLPHLMP